MTINTNISPYFDDFDEKNKFYRILFKPELAVQARELNQLQTQLQDQIAKFGKHVFVNGTIVLNSERFFEDDLISIKYTGNINVLVVGKNVVGTTSGAVALVKAINTQTKKLIVKNISGAKFDSTETLEYIDDNSATVTINLDLTNTFGKAMMFSVNSGIIFINDNFVYNDKQSIVLDDTTNLSTHVVGFKVEESITTADDNESLLDNAQGSPNFSAPGADRYYVNLKLVSLPVSPTSTVTTASSVQKDFVELAKIQNGELIYVQRRTIYAELEKELARRTFDESGNYTVRPFNISFEDHISKSVLRPNIIAGGIINTIDILDKGETYTSQPVVTIFGDGSGATADAIIDNDINSSTYQQIVSITVTNGGSGYTSEETYVKISGDVNKFSIKVEPGKAYIKGFEFETTSATYLTNTKARTTQSVDNVDSPLFFGNFVYVNSLLGQFDTDSFVTVELHDLVRTSAVNGSVIGSAKMRFLDYVSGTIGTAGAIYKFYLFDIVINPGKLFTNLESIVIRSGPTVTSGANIDLLSKLGGVVSNDAVMFGTDKTSLVFPLNHPYIKELRDSIGNAQNDYTFKRVFPSITFSGGVGSISTNNGLERFVGGAGSYSLTNIQNNYHFVVTSVGTSPYTLGQIITPNSAVGNTISPGSSQSLSFTFTGSGGFSAQVIASINANAQTEKTKSLQPYQIKIISSPNLIRGLIDSIGISDIYKVLSIYNTGTTNPTTVSVNGTTGALTWGAVPHTDVTSNYTIDNGQRDDYYDHGGIILSGAAPAVADHLLIVFNNFNHTNSGFFGVGSYSIPYQDIPIYTSPVSGQTISLADVIDFRPRRINNSTSFSNVQLPDPDSQFNTDYNYYVGRIDKLIANSSKSFSIKQGNPDTIPKVPSDEQDGMTLFVIEVPPFTVSLKDITVKYIENKRYTMRDIGGLDKRISNLEYYSQLSLLEQRANEQSILDSSNLEKFKNGFFVDSFSTSNVLENSQRGGAWAKQIWGWWNHRDDSVITWNRGTSQSYDSSVSDSLNPDYTVAIDPLESEMRAEALSSFVEFDYVSSTGAVKQGDLVTLDYTEKTIVSNPVASKSININPFSVIAFNGSIKLDPSSDNWVDTEILPTVTRLVDIRLPDAASRNVVLAARRRGNRVVVVSSRIDTNVVGQNTSSLGSNITDVQYVPFIRARTVLAKCSKFKPKARIYPFMETISFGANSTPLPLITTSNHVNELFIEEETINFRTGSISGPIVGTAKVLIYSPPTTLDNTKRLLTVQAVTGTIPATGFITSGTKSCILLNNVIGTAGQPLIPDEFGLLGFSFNIPAGTIRTGLRELRLIDNVDNIENGSESVGTATYFAQGILQSRQETLLTTRSVQQQRVNNVVIIRQDPLAQTIIVDSRLYPNGYHISSVDIFFKTKSSSVPVSLEITRTVNGYPESNITSIPFAIVNKTPDQINISQNGSAVTNFKLPSLIHLIPGEYAIVLKANTIEYEVFVGEMGRTDLITGQIISKQPDTGVLFKSQNASTWTAYQEEDLKFNLNIAQFDSAGVVEFDSANIPNFDYSYLRVNTSNVVPSKTGIVWEYKGLNPGTPTNIVDPSYLNLSTNVDIPLDLIKRIAGVGSIKLQATLVSEDINVSPVIDLEGLNAILINNNINTTNISVTDNELDPIGGDVLARYISRKITLNDGFDASNLVVTFDAYKPRETDIRVYYKTSPTESTTPFIDNSWVAMKMQTSVPNSVSNLDYREHKFFPANSFSQYGVPVDDPISPRFNIYAIKIVLVSNNQAFSPRVKNLRAIALDS